MLTVHVTKTELYREITSSFLHMHIHCVFSVLPVDRASPFMQITEIGIKHPRALDL